MTTEEMRELVKECRLDWQKGYVPLFDGDPTNRYEVLIEAIEAKYLTRIAELEAALATEKARLDWLEPHNFFEGGYWEMAHDADTPGKWWVYESKKTEVGDWKNQLTGFSGTVRECIDYMMRLEAQKGEEE